MTLITGEVTELLNKTLNWQHAGGSQVIVLLDGKPIGKGTVDTDDQFSVEIPDETRGEIEVQVGIHGAAPSLVDADGDDLHVQIIFNPGGPLV